MGSQTAEEVKKQQIQVMGPDLGGFFNALSNEFYWLQFKWQEYVELFGTSPERIELLNAAAPSFFQVIQDSLWDDMLIHLARLTDSPKSRGKRNLTFRALPGLIEGEFSDQVQDRIAAALSLTEFARDWRNRRLAHRDLALVLESSVDPLPPVSREKLREALEGLHAVLWTINDHYFGSDLQLEVVSGRGGALSLLYVVREGLDSERSREERIRSGELIEQDHRPPEAV